MTPFEGLEGRVLTGIAVSNDGESSLRLTFADGSRWYVTTEGDCCSEAWWADVLHAASCYGGAVVGTEELALPEPTDNRTRQEYDSVYGFALHTTRGTVTLAFRNSSNGYYGGWAYGAAELSKHVKIADDEWRDITTDDWQA